MQRGSDEHDGPLVGHLYVQLGDEHVFYRASEPDAEDAPVLLMLHRFLRSHHVRRLMDLLGGSYCIVAPDYPVSGLAETSDHFDYTFDRLAEVTEAFVEPQPVRAPRLRLRWAVASGSPSACLSVWRASSCSTPTAVWRVYSTDDRQVIALTLAATGTGRSLLTQDGTSFQYDHGTVKPSLLPPKGWLLDYGHVERPGRLDAQVALEFDYKTNLDPCPRGRSGAPPSSLRCSDRGSSSSTAPFGCTSRLWRRVPLGPTGRACLRGRGRR